jgi:ABC-type amino acid transport substrate-binding protein
MLSNCHLQALPSAHSPTRSRLSILAAAALAVSFFAGPSYAAGEAQPFPQTPQREKLTITPAEVMKPWTGDLDGMIQRRVIRILTVYSKTFYFVDKGVQRGGAYDAGRLFVEDLNKKLAKDSKQKHKHLKVQAVFIPIARGSLLPALVAGKGDIAMSSLGVTEERQKVVDFSSPLVTNVSVLLVSGPGSPAVSSLDDLAGKERSSFVNPPSITKSWWP